MQVPSSRHPMSPEFAMCMDQEDPLREFRDRFEIPKDVIYLAGNCVGLQPRRAHRYILQAYFDGRGGGAATQSAPATLAES
jgi:kynureninase